MRVATQSCFYSAITIKIDNIEIHAQWKLKYSKQSKFKSNWPRIPVIEFKNEIYIEIEMALLNKIYINVQNVMNESDANLMLLHSNLSK